MTYSLVISDEASFDIIDSFNWYEAISESIAGKFEKEIESHLLLIRSNPNHFQLKYKSVRILFLKKFPFGIHYVIDNDFIKVIAVFHTSRNPMNWDERLK